MSVQTSYRPRGFQEVKAPRFPDNRHIKVVRLSALCTGRLNPQEIFLILTTVRGWVDPRAIAERITSMKNSTDPSGIESATLKLVAQCLNQLCVQKMSTGERRIYTDSWHVWQENFRFADWNELWIKLERRRNPVLREDDSIIPNIARRYIVNMARHTDGTQCNIFHPTASSVL